MSAGPHETRMAAAALLRGEACAVPCLVVRNGPAAGRRFPLGPSQTLGRARSADFRLPDPAASRLHARIHRTGGGFALADLRSKNGVRVNGKRFRGERPLEIGDEVAIGATRLTLEPGLFDAPAPKTGPLVAPSAERTPSGPLTARGARTLLAAAAVLLAAAAMLLGRG